MTKRWRRQLGIADYSIIRCCWLILILFSVALSTLFPIINLKTFLLLHQIHLHRHECRFLHLPSTSLPHCSSFPPTTTSPHPPSISRRIHSICSILFPSPSRDNMANARNVRPITPSKSVNDGNLYWRISRRSVPQKHLLGLSVWHIPNRKCCNYSSSSTSTIHQPSPIVPHHISQRTPRNYLPARRARRAPSVRNGTFARRETKSGGML